MLTHCVLKEKFRTLALTALFALFANAYAAKPSIATEADTDLLDLSLEQLLDIQITSVAKKSQSISQAAAAIFVITQDDIERSGAHSIPEALRMAPGVQVAQIDANKWAVSARGFNGRFANKLLVLMDGRTLYTPLFSGVFWDVQDIVMEDIERIEVIRGPGAALWGANAVNGVINIITKATSDTHGGHLHADVGNDGQSTITLRYGDSLDNGGDYRVYGKYSQYGEQKLATSDAGAGDDGQMGHAGFRFDWNQSESNSWTVQGDIYNGESGQTTIVTAPIAPNQTIRQSAEEAWGGNLLGRWQHILSDDSELQLQAYYDYTSRDGVLFGEQRHTFDIDFQHRFEFGDVHDVIWGLGYRFTKDDFSGTYSVSLDPAKRSTNLYSAFVQDDITLVKDKLRLTVGTKLEYNDFSGFEIQPNIRLLWTPDHKQTLWTAVSRAVRTPARGDHDNRVNGLGFGIGGGVIPVGDPQNPFPHPMIVSISGDNAIDSERLIAYELGYRIQANADFSFDLAIFYNDYKNLRSSSIGSPVCDPGGESVSNNPTCIATASNIILPVTVGDANEATTYGLEIATDWRVNDWWRIQAGYSYLQIDLEDNDNADGNFDGGASPKHQFSIHSALDLHPNWKFDFQLRYVDELPVLNIDDYWNLDMRLAWKPQEDLEFSITGKNLLDNQHQEFTSELGDLPPVAIERAVYGEVRWSF